MLSTKILKLACLILGVNITLARCHMCMMENRKPIVTTIKTLQCSVNTLQLCDELAANGRRGAANRVVTQALTAFGNGRSLSRVTTISAE